MRTMNLNQLTTPQEWDNYWDQMKLPAEVRKGKDLYINEILKIFDRFLPKNENLSILEVGGAPGRYLAYMARNFQYKICVLDYSEVGCKKTNENLKLLNLPGMVFKKDLFSDLSDLPKFDIVYSLGFIEHFSDLETTIKKHLELLKVGGILVIGTPNFLGINGLFINRLAPQEKATYNSVSMDIKNWKNFEKDFNLKPVFKGYIGGFEPGIYHCKNITILNMSILFFLNITKLIIFDRFKFLRNFNSKYWSGYVIGIYQKIE